MALWGQLKVSNPRRGVVSEGDITSMESVQVVWLPDMDSNHELDKFLKSRNLLIIKSH